MSYVRLHGDAVVLPTVTPGGLRLIRLSEIMGIQMAPMQHLAGSVLFDSLHFCTGFGLLGMVVERKLKRQVGPEGIRGTISNFKNAVN